VIGLVRPHGGERSAFDARRIRMDDAPPSPLPRRVLAAVLALLVFVAVAIAAGRLDIVAVADGRLVPRTLVKIVQPADGGVVREVLVGEGDAVVPGQPLVRLDARLADADVRAQRGQLHDALLQLRRIDAELSNAPLVRHDDDPQDAFERARARFEANRAAHRDALALATAQVSRIAQDLAAATEVEAKLAGTVPIVQTVAARYERLRSDGFVSELAALDRERERIEREQDWRSQRHSVAALRAGLDQAQRQLAQVASALRRQLHAERGETAAQLARLREELDKQLVRREQVDLVAPVAGTVKDVAATTIGAVAGAGAVLVTIVPSGEPLEADVLVRNEDAGFVRSGQRVQLKVVAYPFQKYGLVEGIVLRVGPDSSEPAPARVADDAGAPMPGSYRARIALDVQSLAYDGDRLPLASGMLAAAEIHLGRRPVLDYLLAPVRKAWHESARER
jgi:HlyD family secretion protein